MKGLIILSTYAVLWAWTALLMHVWWMAAADLVRKLWPARRRMTARRPRIAPAPAAC